MQFKFFFWFSLILVLLIFSNSVSAACSSNSDCPTGTECDMSMGTWGACTPAAATSNPCGAVICQAYCENGVTYTNGVCAADSSKAAGYVCNYTQIICESNQCDTINPYSQLSERCAPTPEPEPDPVQPTQPVQNLIQEVKGIVYYVDEKSNIVPIPYAKIVFEYNDPQGNHHENANNFFTWTDVDGKFSWSNNTVFAPGNTIDVLISFEDKDGKIKMVTDNSNMFYLGRSLSPTDSIWNNFEKNLDNWDNRSLGKIYIHALKAVAFKENVLKETPTTLENILAYTNVHGTSHLGEVYSSSPNAQIGMRIKYSDARFANPEAPTNREFHEYCHHIQEESFNEKRIPLGGDHNGYFNNPSTEWGLIEGWAEFCALEMKRYYKIGKPWLYEYGNRQDNLELDYQMDSNQMPKTSEEFAIAGIFLDLRDSVNDYGAHDDDAVALPLSEIWKAFSEIRDFGDGQGTRHVHTVRDLYVALNEVTADNQGIHTPDRVNGLDALDTIFVRHKVFQDIDSNRYWSTGEQIGYSGKGQLMREEVEPEPGTDLVFNIQSTSGSLLATNLLAQVTVSLDSPNEYLSYDYIVPVQNNKISLPLIPEQYSGTITVTALEGGTEQTAENSFTITSQEMQTNVNPDQPIGTYTSTIELQSVSCTNTSECEYWNAGNECSSSQHTCYFSNLLETSGKLDLQTQSSNNESERNLDETENSGTFCSETNACPYGYNCVNGYCIKEGSDQQPEPEMDWEIVAAVTVLVLIAGILFSRKKNPIKQN
ncbi:MAG: hypothetical protein Q7S92_03060 [Candidatus Diapherotrites archaeon]|nr:hypothetical protein [Candidatus Diapherotrites archaeon]